MIKTCYRCKFPQSYSEFYRCSVHTDRLKYECKSCVKQYNAKWRKANPTYYAVWNANNRQRLGGYDRKSHYKRTYEITLLELEDLRLLQEYKCALCGLRSQNLVVDHCHDTDQFRGLLCLGCNTFEGHLKKYTNAGLLSKVLAWQNIHVSDNRTN